MIEIDALSLVVLILLVPASFILSSAAGLGGSLILVPALLMVMDVKEGVALAALFLAFNNLTKLAAYRNTLPVKESVLIAISVMLGAAMGASLMMMAPESWVKVFVIAALLSTFFIDVMKFKPVQKVWGVLLAFTSGATSGLSGMSGPLKGVAIKSLGLKRQYFVGVAAIVSTVGDMTKALVFSHSGLLGQFELMLAVVLIPIMILCTYTGRKLNQGVGERGYAVLFWAVMAAYTSRLVLAS